NVCLVCEGDAVTISANSPNFVIKTQGIALSSGNLNKQIKVRNTHSGKVIRSKVTAINQVTIHL
ncbi:MAG: flagella basal body P-ring formation protein FlgA, partial [Cognaticolwellia sp.]